MERISLDNKTNFFDNRVSDYSKASIQNVRNALHLTANDDDDDF